MDEDASIYPCFAMLLDQKVGLLLLYRLNCVYSCGES